MNKRKFLPSVTSALLLFVGIGATAGGLGAMMDPSGESMGVPIRLLEQSPFENFLIPGIFLFFIIGIASLIVSYLAFKNYRHTGIATMVLGMVMILWISAQMYWLTDINWLHHLFLGIGIVEIILGFFFYVRRNGHRIFHKHRGSAAH